MPYAEPFRANHDGGWQIKVLLTRVDIFTTCFASVHKNAFIFEVAYRVLKVGHLCYKHIRNCARASANNRFIDLHSAIFRYDYAVNTSTFTRADDGTKVVRVLKSVK